MGRLTLTGVEFKVRLSIHKGVGRKSAVCTVDRGFKVARAGRAQPHCGQISTEQVRTTSDEEVDTVTRDERKQR